MQSKHKPPPAGGRGLGKMRYSIKKDCFQELRMQIALSATSLVIPS